MNGATRRFSTRAVHEEIRTQVAPALDEVASRAHRLPYSDRSIRTLTLQLLEWCVREGIEIEMASAFHPDVIDRFCVEECGHLASGTRLNYQSKLRRIGAELLGPPLYPPKTASLRSSKACAPYSADEVRNLFEWSRGLPTDAMRVPMRRLITLGLATGVTSAEASVLRGRDVLVDDHGVLVDVPGEKRRTVPVVRRWEEEMATLAGDGDSFVLMPARLSSAPKDISRLIERCPRGHAPKVSTQRLRATWLCGLLDAAVPLRVIAELAGARATQVADYARFTAPIREDEVRVLIRGVRDTSRKVFSVSRL